MRAIFATSWRSARLWLAVSRRRRPSSPECRAISSISTRVTGLVRAINDGDAFFNCVRTRLMPVSTPRATTRRAGRCCRASGGMRRSRAQTTRPPRQPRTPAEIQVLEMHEVRAVEIAGRAGSGRALPGGRPPRRQWDRRISPPAGVTRRWEAGTMSISDRGRRRSAWSLSIPIQD